MKPFRLTIVKALRPSELPNKMAAISAGEDIIEVTYSWKKGKTFNKEGVLVHTLSRPKGPDDGAPWHCRISKHTPDECSFDELWDKLSVNKAENEMQFIPDLQKVTEIKRISPNESIWSLYYTFSPPISPRVFTVLQVVHYFDSAPRCGIVVSIPVDLSGKGDEGYAIMEERGVKGRYVSVERVLEMEGGIIEWRMATSGTPAGSIPNFLVERTMPGKISEDVSKFLKWKATLPQKSNSGKGVSFSNDAPINSGSANSATAASSPPA